MRDCFCAQASADEDVCVGKYEAVQIAEPRMLTDFVRSDLFKDNRG